MQIEKHNDRSLFCYITEEELKDLDISIDTLTYGTNSFRRLVALIIKEAADRQLFSACDTPLMVEAVPLHSMELFLQITAIDEADELDFRFAQFSPSIFEEIDLDDDDEEAEPAKIEDTNSIYAPEEKTFTPPKTTSGNFKSRQRTAKNSRKAVYVFDSYDTLITALRSAGCVADFSNIKSSLYYHPDKKQYYLVLLQYQNSAPIRALLHSVCEYASMRPMSSSLKAWLAEHCRCLIRSHAISHLLTAISKD